MFGIAVTVLAFAIPTIPALVGQLWMAEGLVGNALLTGPRDPVIPALAWTLSLAFAVVALLLLATLAARWFVRTLDGATTVSDGWHRLVAIGRAPTGLLLAFVVGYAAEVAIVVSLGAYPLDRYLWPIIPVLAIVLVRGSSGHRAPRWSVGLACIALAWLGASALAIASNSFAYDAARWRAGEAAVAAGYAPSAVDAGYEWVGYHAAGHANLTAPEATSTWYTQEFMPAPPCAIVSNGADAPSAYRLVHADPTAYRQYLAVGSFEPLYLYGSTDATCPALPAP
jgi:hypothetical protein